MSDLRAASVAALLGVGLDGKPMMANPYVEASGTQSRVEAGHRPR